MTTNHHEAALDGMLTKWSDAPRPVYERKLELETVRAEVIVRLALRSLDYAIGPDDYELAMGLKLDDITGSRITVTVHRRPYELWKYVFAKVLAAELTARIDYWLFEGGSHFMMTPVKVVFA